MLKEDENAQRLDACPLHIIQSIEVAIEMDEKEECNVTGVCHELKKNKKKTVNKVRFNGR